MRRDRLSIFNFATILVTVYLAASSSNAQNSFPTPSPSPPSLEREFFKNILRDQKAIWTTPSQLQRKDMRWMIPSGIGAMALFTTDRITGDEIAEANGQVKASRIVSYVGSGYGTGAVATAFYLIGRTRKDARARETGILTAEALIDSSIFSGGLKTITQRARPIAGRERSEFFDGGYSFPSGHSVQAWSAAAVIASEYHDKPWIKVAAYGVAGAVSVARFTEHKHYISDVVVGSVAGYAIGKYVYRAHHRDTSDSVQQDSTQSRWPMIMPQFAPHHYGAQLTWTF